MIPDAIRLHDALYRVGLSFLNEQETAAGCEVRLYRLAYQPDGAISHNQRIAIGTGWNMNAAKADCFRQVPEVPLEARIALAALACNNLLGALNR